MENIVNTNNTNLRLCELRVGLFNTLRVSLPMVSPDATNVQVLLTNGTITTAYSATKNTDGVWLCDIDAAQFSAFGKQKYEVAYKLDNKQFWDGQGWVNIVPATTSGIVPQPVPPPHRWAIISITQGDITHYADENGDINLDDITRVSWDNVTGKPDFANVATSGSYNDLKDVPTEFPPSAHSHASDGWFTTEIEGVKLWSKSLLPDWLTPSREEPPTQDFVLSVEYKANNARDEAQLAENKAEDALVHADEALAGLDGKANVSDLSPTNPAPYVSALFNDSNTYLTGVIDARLPYPLYAVPSTGLLKDRAINTTSLASVTVPNDFTDLLIRASVASSLAVTMPDAITTKYGDTFPAAAGEYLITITKTGAAETYVRVIKLEVAQ